MTLCTKSVKDHIIRSFGVIGISFHAHYPRARRWKFEPLSWSRYFDRILKSQLDKINLQRVVTNASAQCQALDIPSDGDHEVKRHRKNLDQFFGAIFPKRR
jgi:hypothetical protein